MTDYKQIIIDALDILRRRDIADKQTFKARAYAKVIEQIKCTTVVHSVADLNSITGMGEKIKEKIEEILMTGFLRSAERVMDVYSIKAYDELMACYGIGPAKAKELIDKHSIHSIADLRKEVKKIPKLLNDKQKLGLKYYDDILLRIPRKEMEDHKKILDSIMNDTQIFEVVGSYRRGAETSGDIDVLICDTDPSVLTDIVQRLVHCKYIKEILAKGNSKCLAICQIAGCPARRLDLLLTPPKEYAYAILYFTGCDTFNVAFRQRAIDRGYTLNEHTLSPLNTSVPAVPSMTSEYDIFNFLGIQWVEPTERKGPADVKPVRKITFIRK